MADISCSHCGEPWEVDGLQHDSIGYLDDDEADKLAPLGTSETVLAQIANTVSADRARNLRETLATIPNDVLAAGARTGDAVALPALFSWWWEMSDLDSGQAAAAKTVVETAIYVGVAQGRGCPACGFDHGDQPGQHRDTTMRQLVDGVDDADPTSRL